MAGSYKHSDQDQRTLEEILQSVSDVLFPAELGKRRVHPDSKDADGDTPLHVVIRRNDYYAVDLLVKAGADINANGDMGVTPLHTAISQGDERIVEALLKAGAKTDIPSEFNETAFEKAEKVGGSIEGLVKQYTKEF